MPTAGPGRAGGGLGRAWAALILGVGVAAGAAAITLLSLIMRSVAAVGGSCSRGGPPVPAHPCPSQTGTALLLVLICAAVCLVGTLWAAPVLQAPLPLLLGWPALCLSLAWNFLQDGFAPPMGEDLAVGYVVCGLLFLLMGTAPLVPRLAAARRARAAGAGRAGPAVVHAGQDR